MDELLHDRIKQLKEIDDRFERIEKAGPVWEAIRSLRFDLALMIAHAEEAYAEF